MRGQLRIDQMFAFIMRDNDGTEGVCAMFSQGAWIPLVGADLARVEDLKPIAQGLARSYGRDITLAIFSHRHNLETIKGTQ